MKLINNVKKSLKSQNYYKDYIKQFPHKQTRFILTLLADKMYPNVDTASMASVEINLLKKKNSNIYMNPLKELSLMSNRRYEKADWESLSNYLWSVWQMSTYHSDIKTGTNNIYTEENYIKLDKLKRDYFYKWTNSLMSIDPNFNELVVALLKKVK